MPELGFGSRTVDRKRYLPNHYFHDLATWHRINSLYSRRVLSEMRHMRFEAERRDLVDRLIRVVDEQRGHTIALAVERGKIALTAEDNAVVAIDGVDDWNAVPITRVELNQAIGGLTARVVTTVSDMLQRAGLKSDQIQTVFMTGGSSLVPILREGILSVAPNARVASGDLLGSVGMGLAIDAGRKFG